MLKFLLILILLCLLAGYAGYRFLRFVTRVLQAVSGIHEEGQRNSRGGPDSGEDSRGDFGWTTGAHGPRDSGQNGPTREKDITGRARVIEEKPGAER
ncbi:MAG: hypothetical protein RIF32_01675 [Leptospirales bacterium]